MIVSIFNSYRLYREVILYKVILFIGYTAIAITTPIIYIDYTSGVESYLFKVTYIVRFIFIILNSLYATFFYKKYIDLIDE